MASSSSLITFSWLHNAILLLVFHSTFYTAMVSCSKPFIPYKQHCASVIPESKPTASSQSIPFVPNQVGFFSGGEEFLNPGNSFYGSSTRKLFLFQTHHVYSTDADDVYKVDASLIVSTADSGFYREDMAHSYSYSSLVIMDGSWVGPLSFEVQGFWSKSTGKLCMVGSSSTLSAEGNTRISTAVLKLNNVGSSCNISSLVEGALESLSMVYNSSPFQPISLLILPQVNYNYTEVWKEVGSVSPAEIDVPSSSSLSLPLSVSICSIFKRNVRSIKLQYASRCSSAQNCNPFGETPGYFPRAMSFSLIQCSDDTRSLRFLVEFSNSTYADYYASFSPNTSLVAEGLWDVKKNQLRVVGCRIISAPDSLAGSHVDDCSFRLSIRFPAVWSMRNTSSIVGQLWSRKPATDPGYFDRIMFQVDGNEALAIPGLKYNYTFVEKARKSCEKEKPGGDGGRQYPDVKSPDMRFYLSVKNSRGERIGQGDSKPIFVDDKVATREITQWISTSSRNEKQSSSSRNGKQSSSSTPAQSIIEASDNKPINMSYQMSFKLSSPPSFHVSAEGNYDDKTGSLCMAGCKYLDSDSQTSEMDCNILVKLQFPPTDSHDDIKGTIESERETSDPLFFEPLSFAAVASYKRYSRESVSRMNTETVMALISYTLVCVFVLCQILHVKKHPKVLPFISLLMLAVLALGHMIPLLLNFDALFFANQNRRTFYGRSSGWLEVNEVMVRVVVMAAFLLQSRLLLLVWSARSADRSQKTSWIAEKRTLYMSLPLYMVGCLIALYLNLKKGKQEDVMHSVWTDLRCYAGLVLDGFLFPQILLNIFHNSRENVLSPFFYMGTTSLRLLPHAYDLYRAHYYIDDFDWSYMYARPGADYYSTSWDVIILLGSLLFAAIIYLQQLYGGRCIIPSRFRELQVYEKVPVAEDA